jgi:hypothetical protein
MAGSSTTATATREHRPDGEAGATQARRDVAATFDTIRSKVGDVGDRMPAVIDGVGAGAADGARMVEAWPEAIRRTVAAFSLGLGVGLTVAGAPRLLVGGALLPAVAVAATGMQRESRGSGRSV